MADLASLTIKPLISPHGLFVSRRSPENSDETHLNFYVSRDVRKPVVCICENKDADQLRGNREADQRL